MKLRYLIIVFYIFLVNGFAQSVLNGVVKDSETGEVMPFAHVLLKGSKKGVLSDIDGQFQLNIPKGESGISCSFVGYTTKTILVNSSKLDVLILMDVEKNALKTVELIAKENPAYAIIRNVIKNRKKNDPEELNAFKYNCYNKVVYDFVFDSSLEIDSAKIKFDKVLQGGHFLMSESVTQRKFLSPDYSEEVVEAMRFSGLKNPMFTSLATDIQPFSFYNELIPFLDIQYLNPISNGALSKYEYYIRDQYLNEKDTTFVIEFYPKKNKNIEALKGFLYINSKTYALVNVIAEPFEKGKVNLKIEQKYDLKSNDIWFPEQLNYVLNWENESSAEPGIKIEGRSYISEVDFDIELKPKNFSIDQVKIEPEAHKKDSLFWNSRRPRALNHQEKMTYTVIDSIGTKMKADKILKLTEELSKGVFSINYVELDFNKTFTYNVYEGFRLGLGLFTSSKFSKYFRFGGYYAYGFNDKDNKFGSSIQANISKDKEAYIKLSYQNDLEELGSFGQIQLGRRTFSQRDIISSNMNTVKQINLRSGVRLLKYLKTDFGLYSAEYTSNYDYKFKASPIKSRRETWSNLSLRWCYKERFIQTLNQRVSMGSQYPVLTFYYNHGLKDVLNGMTNFNRYQLSVDYSRFIKNFGKTSLTINMGFVDGDIPAYFMFTGSGGLDEKIKIVTPKTFQTMEPNEYISNTYVHVFYKHSFGSLLFNKPNFKPQLSILQNLGWSEQRNISNHEFEIPQSDLSKGYFETGLVIDNLCRIDYFDVGYLGVGVGAFANYGYYADPKFKDNVVFKFSVIFTTK